jgi:uncharacterized repeat protein (TIGR03803 family)
MRRAVLFLGCVTLASCSPRRTSSPLPAGAAHETLGGFLAGNRYKVVFRFGGKSRGLSPGTDGAAPGYGKLIDVGGTLYGTTQNGGDARNNGTVYKITTAGVEKTVYRFKGGKDGANPIASLVALNGNLSGTTQAGGGPASAGTAFMILP